MKGLSLTLMLLCVLLTTGLLTAQSQSYHQGRFSLSAGVGLLPAYMKDKSVNNSIPVNFRAGFRISKMFSMNAFAGFASATTETRSFGDGFATYLVNKSMAIGIRGQMNKEVSNRMNIYGGVMLGYHFANINEYLAGSQLPYERNLDAPTPYDPNAPEGKLLYAAYVGTSYFFTKSIGIFGELGYGISLLNMGFTFKI